MNFREYLLSLPEKPTQLHQGFTDAMLLIEFLHYFSFHFITLPNTPFMFYESLSRSKLAKFYAMLEHYSVDSIYIANIQIQAISYSHIIDIIDMPCLKLNSACRHVLFALVNEVKINPYVYLLFNCLIIVRLESPEEFLPIRGVQVMQTRFLRQVL